MTPVRALSAFSALFVAVLAAPAQDPHDAFRDIPWGASEETLLSRNLGTVVSTNRVYIKQFQESEEAVYIGNPTMMAVSKELIIEGKRKELFRFFLVRDRLCFVIHRPPITDIFAPAKVLNPLEARYGKPAIRTDLKLPFGWGKLDPAKEKFETFDWENERGRVRAACRTWPGGDRREIFYVAHVSKAMIEENQRIIEEERRKAEEERKRLEEEARKAAEEAAKKAAAAAAAAAAAGTPAIPPKP